MDFIILLFGLLLLVLGAEFIIRGSVSLAKHLNISLFTIGVVIVAAGTSLPELANCIRTVIIDHSDIAVGAIIGSNIANIFLIMGATTILFPINIINKNEISQCIVNLFIVIGLIIFSLLSLSFNILYGITAILLLILIMFYQIKAEDVNLNELKEHKTYSIYVAIVLIVLGILILIIGSRYFIESAVKIAEIFSVPESIIGLSLVAFGTSLPELVVGLLAAFRKRVDFALGNVLGSNIYNVLGILGLCSFFGDFKIPNLIANYDLYIMASTIFFIFGFMIIFKKLNRVFGLLSVCAYTIYILSLYLS